MGRKRFSPEQIIVKLRVLYDPNDLQLLRRTMPHKSMSSKPDPFRLDLPDISGQLIKPHSFSRTHLD